MHLIHDALKLKCIQNNYESCVPTSKRLHYLIILDLMKIHIEASCQGNNAMHNAHHVLNFWNYRIVHNKFLCMLLLFIYRIIHRKLLISSRDPEFNSCSCEPYKSARTTKTNKTKQATLPQLKTGLICIVQCCKSCLPST